MPNWKTNKGKPSQGECDCYFKMLELLHVDLIVPTRIESLGGKRYIMVIVDDFSRYTWVEFLREKPEAREKLETFYLVYDFLKQNILLERKKKTKRIS